MVDTAKGDQALAEKLLKEANGKIDVLQAEVKALKELVLTSTPSTPNKHLYPHLNNSNSTHKSHSRQSSLNQQTLNTVIQANNSNTTNPSATSTPSSCTSNTQNSINSLTKSDSKLPVSHSTNCLQAVHNSNPKEKVSLFKTHKRVPSQNDIQPKSFIDKLFNQNQKQQMNDYTLNDTQISDASSQIYEVCFKFYLVKID